MPNPMPNPMSNPMPMHTPERTSVPFAATLPVALLETILTQVAALLLTGAAGHSAAARHAAAQLLATYHPETENELRLAANIVSFSLHALEALAQAAAPELPMTRTLRLRGSAVSLSRESHKPERRLAQLQKARQQGTQAQPAAPQPEPIQPEPVQPEPAQPEQRVEKPIALIQDTVKTGAVAQANGLTWTQAYEQRQREARIAASLQRAEARIAAHANAATSAAVRVHQTQATTHAP